MEDLQAWFAPLMWVLGTIGGIIAFVRLCKPVWTLLQTPKQLNETLIKLDAKITDHFSEIDLRLDKFDSDLKQLKEFDKLSDEVQINLLRDRLSQGYQYYAERDFIGTEAYRSLCDIYKVYEKCGGNSYAHTIMEQIHELYRKSSQKRSQPYQDGLKT